MKPTVTWIVAADGARVRVFEHLGPGKGLKPVSGLNLEDAHLRAKDINTDRPGRTSSSTGQGSAMTPRTDPVDHEEETFVKMIADVLRVKKQAGAFDRLIIAADPSSLGTLRAALCDAVDKSVVAELPKDLTKVPLADMPKHLDGLIAV
jgi:protein required for attachment to host cells